MPESNALPSESNAAASGWRARLDLEFDQREGATFLARRRHVGPLLVQRPFYPEPNACHVYVVHPPGGVAGGDDLTITVDARPGTHALVTTPAATKFYRCERKRSRQQQWLEVDTAVLEWLPQESIFFPDADTRSDTIVRLKGAARFIGWEIPCLGLPVRKESFDRGRLALNFELWVDDEPRFVDRLRLDGTSAARRAVWGLAGHDAIGTLLAYPATDAMLTAVREVQSAEVELSATRVDDVLVCRYLGAQGEPVKRACVATWQVLRPLLIGRNALPPRIWAT
jgi:urease accessory protein